MADAPSRGGTSPTEGEHRTRWATALGPPNKAHWPQAPGQEPLALPTMHSSSSPRDLGQLPALTPPHEGGEAEPRPTLATAERVALPAPRQCKRGGCPDPLVGLSARLPGCCGAGLRVPAGPFVPPSVRPPPAQPGQACPSPSPGPSSKARLPLTLRSLSRPGTQQLPRASSLQGPSRRGGEPISLPSRGKR